MKLNHTEPGPGCLPVVRAHQREPETFCQPSLTCARRALENEVFLGAPALEDSFKFLACEKRTLIGDVVYRVRRLLFFGLDDFVLFDLQGFTGEAAPTTAPYFSTQ